MTSSLGLDEMTRVRGEHWRVAAGSCLTPCFHTHPVYEEGLRVLHDLECHQQADRNQVVVQDDKRQQVVAEII